MRDNWYTLTNDPRKLVIREIMNDYNSYVSRVKIGGC